jgi:hypothetical protein
MAGLEMRVTMVVSLDTEQAFASTTRILGMIVCLVT